MGAFTHVTGPQEIAVRFRGQAQGSYLGTAVTAPEIDLNFATINVMNDLGGRSVPFQKVFDGEQHVLSAVLNRVDMTVLKQIRDLTHNVSNLGYEGQIERGTLMIGNNDFELQFNNVFYGQSAAPAQSDTPAGRRYASAILLAAKESTVGTRVQEIALQFECNAVFNPTARAFDLFTENPNLFFTYTLS